jgi:hypothetical protein
MLDRTSGTQQSQLGISSALRVSRRDVSSKNGMKSNNKFIQSQKNMQTALKNFKDYSKSGTRV